jgi:nitrate reductase gamma subunit
LSRLDLFYIVAAIAGAIFLLGLATNLAFWLTGVKPGERWRGLWSFLGFTLSPRGIWLLFSQGLAQGHLFRESRLRWAMSVALAWGALELFFVGSLGNSLQKYGIFDLSKDDAWFATVNDIGGLLLLLGLVLAAVRRYVVRESKLSFAWDDGIILAWIALAALSGFVAEAGRLLSEAVPAGVAGHSFAGGILAEWLGSLGVNGSAEPYLWWGHAVISLGLLAYLPYSKLFHIFTGPLSMLARGRELLRREAHVGS